MSPRAWYRLRPKWQREIAALALGFSLILATVLWASRKALVGLQAPATTVAEPDFPTWARLVAFGVTATVTVTLWVVRTGMTVRKDISDQFRSLATTQETMAAQLNRIDGALTGYNGFGGILPRLETVEGELKTVDERIRKSKHDLRTEMTTVAMQSHDQLDDRIKEVAEELRDFKEEVRTR